MKYFFKKRGLLHFILCIYIFLIIPNIANGAILFTSPSNIDLEVGDTFTLSVNTDSQNSFINAASLDIKYDTNLLSVRGIGHTESIFSLWLEEPTNSITEGVVHFSGGLSSPGWSGNFGNIIKITFVAKAPGQTQIALINGAELLNDGIGTNVLNGTQGTNIKISESASSQKESLPPESFSEGYNEISEQENSFIIPVLYNVPANLHEESKLNFEGRSLPYSDVQVYIQKGNGDIEITQTRTGENGKFSVTYQKPVISGFYKIWAKNLSYQGVLGSSSEVYYVEIINKSSFNLFNNEISYKNWGTILSILLLLALILCSILLLKIKKQNTRNIDQK